MNLSYPPSRSVALVSFIILGCNDTNQKAVDATAKSTRIDDKALKSVINFETRHAIPGRYDTAADRLDHKLPYERLLNEYYPFGVS